MTTVKTAISLPAALKARLDELAEELGVPRSRLVAQAIAELLARRDDDVLLAALNRAYGDDADDERALTRRHATGYRDLLEDGW